MLFLVACLCRHRVSLWRQCLLTFSNLATSPQNSWNFQNTRPTALGPLSGGNTVQWGAERRLLCVAQLFVFVTEVNLLLATFLCFVRKDAVPNNIFVVVSSPQAVVVPVRRRRPCRVWYCSNNCLACTENSATLTEKFWYLTSMIL